jgi:GTP-binding protein
LKRLTDAEVRGVIQQAASAHNMPRKGKLQLSIKDVAQTDVNPPTFTFRVNYAHLVHFSYRRFLENQLRLAFGFTGTPLRMVFSTGGDS